jgi:hypothetical protein
MLNSMPFNTGLNEDLLNQLAGSVSSFKKEEKICILMLDEMAIKPQLLYNCHSDIVSGYVDRGKHGRLHIVARQALVFLVRNIGGSWKQPVAYYFSEAATNSVVLATLIKEVVGALKGVGLIIAATVCDMGQNNLAALRHLGDTYREPYFDVDGERVFTLYDVPHLLKCFRNLFLKYNVAVDISLGEEVVNMQGSWAHIKALAEESAVRSPFDP